MKLSGAMALGITGLAGFVAGHLISERRITPNRILARIRGSFRHEGPVTGSWIINRPFDYQHYAFKTKAYRGGITRLEDSATVNYEFLADANTGTLLSLKRVA